MMKHYSELEKISGTAIDVRNTGKNLFCPRRRRKYSERRKFYWHQGVYKNSQSVKYANVTIPAKGPAYLRRVSCGYVERSPLHFVLWLELFTLSKHIGSHMASFWFGSIYGVRRCKTAPSLAALWSGRKKQRFSGTNQKSELPRPFGTGLLKPCPQGLFFARIFFSPV